MPRNWICSWGSAALDQEVENVGDRSWSASEEIGWPEREITDSAISQQGEILVPR
jgi:hypothetical protein